MNLTSRMRKKHPVRRGIFSKLHLPRMYNQFLLVHPALDLIWAA
jgi:hypothetical protein